MLFFSSHLFTQKTIVLRGEVKGVLILYSIFLALIAGFQLIYFNTQVLITMMSVWFGTGIFGFMGAITHSLVLDSEGFLYRKYIFPTFSQKWKYLTSAPEVVIFKPNWWQNTGRMRIRYIIKFLGSQETWSIETGNLKIKDIKTKNGKMNFIGKIATEFYEKAHSFYGCFLLNLNKSSAHFFPLFQFSNI